MTLRPSLFSEFTGQPKVKERLEIAVEAARRRKEPLDHILLSGPPGLGKTTLAHIIAQAMGANVRATSGPTIEKAGDLVESGKKRAKGSAWASLGEFND